jgi:hypothetical protein
MYKDLEKQKAANKLRQQKYRNAHGVTPGNVTPFVTPTPIIVTPGEIVRVTPDKPASLDDRHKLPPDILVDVIRISAYMGDDVNVRISRALQYQNRRQYA